MGFSEKIRLPVMTSCIQPSVKTKNYTQARQRLVFKLTAVAGINATHPAEAAKNREAFRSTALRLAEFGVAHRQRGLQKSERRLAELAPRRAQEARHGVFPVKTTNEEALP